MKKAQGDTGFREPVRWIEHRKGNTYQPSSALIHETPAMELQVPVRKEQRQIQNQYNKETIIFQCLSERK